MKKSRILKIGLLLALASALGACSHDIYRQDYYSYRPYKAPATVSTDAAGSPTTLTPVPQHAPAEPPVSEPLSQ